MTDAGSGGRIFPGPIVRRSITSTPPPMSSKGWIFVAGVLALALSLYLWFTGSPQAAIFVGLWVPSLWILADLVDTIEPADS